MATRGGVERWREADSLSSSSGKTPHLSLEILRSWAICPCSDRQSSPNAVRKLHYIGQPRTRQEATMKAVFVMYSVAAIGSGGPNKTGVRISRRRPSAGSARGDRSSTPACTGSLAARRRGHPPALPRTGRSRRIRTTTDNAIVMTTGAEGLAARRRPGRQLRAGTATLEPRP